MNTETEKNVGDYQPESETQESKKYAGKFDTIEQLEEGYKNAAKIYQENEALKAKIDSYRAPDDYFKPDGVELADSELQELKNIAKNANLTQEHFDRVANQWALRSKTQKEKFNESLKEIGEENYNVLKDYVTKNYPEKVATTVMDKLILDKEARSAALAHRDKLLNSTVPGISTVNGAFSYTVTHNDVLKAREAANAQPANMKLRENYLKLTSEYAKQKQDV